MPVGVTAETVRGVVAHPLVSPISCVVSVTVSGLFEVKREIFGYLRALAEVLGADYREVVVEPWDVASSIRLYKVLREASKGCSRVVVSGVTGSRYLLPLMFQVLLALWAERRVKVYLVQGVEGEEWRLVPLMGYLSVRLPRRQRELFLRIYSWPSDEVPLRGGLLEGLGLGRSVYKALKELELKGLIVHRRNKVIKTFPGKILYGIMVEKIGSTREA
ncbi:MAG: hypothetical protein F7C35_00160 [Desulfurococcales archaeon]|nr:hypothetical protein [Desulfurococcales archaeon]